MLRRFVRTAMFAGWVSIALYGAACEHEHDPVTNEELADVVYIGNTNDEALELLLATAAVDDPDKEVALTSPEEGASIPSPPIPTFSWESAVGSSHKSPQRPWIDELFGIPMAHAHGPPVNGVAYFVVFRTASNDKLLRIFTTETSYQPDAATWEKMVGAGAPISCAITHATFDNNLLAADGGPFAGPSVTFTITP